MQPRLPIQILLLKPQFLFFNVIWLTHFLQRIAPHSISRPPDVVAVDLGQLFTQPVEIGG